MEEEVDYFSNIEAMPPGKRRISRLETQRVLKSIAKQRRGFEVGWTAGKASIMKTYPIKRYPKWFADPGKDVEIQVAIRPIPGKTSKNALIPGLSALEVYYRFKKTLAKIKTEEKENIAEEDRTEEYEFDSGKDIVEFSEWRGSILISSSIANMFYRLLSAIGAYKVEGIIKRLNRKK
jgi:hypothetical protein